MIDEIYEAAMLPENWPKALQTMADRVGVAGCTLVTIDAAPRWAASTGLEADMQQYMTEGWHERNDPMALLLRDTPYGFVREIDIFPLETVEALPIVRDFKRPKGLGWSAGMATLMPGGEMLVFSIEQFYERGPLGREILTELEALRPHLSRAALLAAKLQHQRAEAAVQSLDLVGVAAAVVTLKGTVLAANGQFLSHGERLVISARNRLRIVSPRSADLMQTALARLATQGPRGAPLSIAVPAKEDQYPLVLHLMPVKGQARDIFGADTTLVVATSMTARTAPNASLLRALFDLTPSESRVAEAIVSGLDKPDALQTLGITAETERTHVKSIFRKTGLNSRVELVRLLGALGVPGRPPA